jgi:hypothetical protein
MPLAIEADKALIWDNQRNKMVVKTRVFVRLLGSRGSVYLEEGPLYAETPQETIEAARLLKSRLVRSLPGS